MPRPVAMPVANDKRRRPERTEAIRILKPAMSNIPKSVSATVAAHANDTVNELGKRDVTAPVYSTKRAKFPQDTFFAPYGPHKPKRSATAYRKEAPSANRANRLTISVPFSLSCAAFEFIRASTEGILLYFLQNGFIGEIQCSRPKLVNGSENRCSFIFDKKYDELRWFRLTRVTAYGMNVFR